MRSDIRILLCGGTGVGKSAVGNTILGSKQFVSGTRPHPVTQVCESATAVIRGSKITVIDTPSTEESELQAEFQRCAELSDSPPEVFLLVTPLGFHGGKALRVLDALQTLFPGYEVDQSTIVLFTGGDRLKELGQRQKEHEAVYCSSELQTLLTRCGNRKHTFNNQINDQAQVLQLLAAINRLLHQDRNSQSNVKGKKRSIEEAKDEENDIWNWPEYKIHLPVECGTKKGVLDREKMAKGHECIEVSGVWYTPKRFEAFAGKGSCKKWKQSIRCQNVPLAELIQDGHLTCPYFTKKAGDQSDFPMWAPDGSLIESGDFQLILTGVEGDLPDGSLKEKLMGNSVIMGDVQDLLQESSLTGTESKTVAKTPQKNLPLPSPSSEPQRDSKVKSKKERISHKSNGKLSPAKEGKSNETGTKKNFDLPVFQENSLPVTCRKTKGVLHKDRFSTGSLGKCIRTDGRWMTPEEFVQDGAGLKSGKWRRDILCHGKPLATLIENQILELHSPLCECAVCKSEDPSDQNDDLCFICSQDTELVCCDGCPRSFHHACHLPPLGQNLGDRWMCTFCIVEKAKELCNRTRTLEEALDCNILPNKQHCQSLLLYLLKEDKELIFMQDPCLTFDNYAAVINKPMWIDKIIKKLRGEYSTVGQFVADVRLMFKNCSTFNKNNECGKMGARLKDLFEKKFRSVFSIK